MSSAAVVIGALRVNGEIQTFPVQAANTQIRTGVDRFSRFVISGAPDSREY